MRSSMVSTNSGTTGAARKNGAGRRARRCGFGRAPQKARAGLTLVEVMLSIGIVALAAIFCIGFLMANIRQNRLTAIQVAALQAVNGMVGTIEDLADATGPEETMAHAVVDHFKKLGTGTIDIGPNRSALRRVEDVPSEGCLLYRFWVPAPGSPQYLESDPRFVRNYSAVGEMRIYLDETYLNSVVLPNFVWVDLSNDPVPADHGMDIDLNGVKTDNHLTVYKDVKQLAISIDVTFYSNESHREELLTASRNLVLAQIKDATKGFDVTAP